MNVSAIDARNLIRCNVVDGAMRGTYESLINGLISVAQGMLDAYLALVHFSRNVIASSGGRSTMMKPLPPASYASWIALSSPYASMGL